MSAINFSSFAMSADDILASLGIAPGVASHPEISVCPTGIPLDITYPTGAVVSLAITVALSITTLGFAMFRFRRISAQYLRDRFEYGLSTRSDLNFRLTYELVVGDEQHSIVTMNSNAPPEALILLDTSLPPRDAAADETELSEVVVD